MLIEFSLSKMDWNSIYLPFTSLQYNISNTMYRIYPRYFTKLRNMKKKSYFEGHFAKYIEHVHWRSGEPHAVSPVLHMF